jgi:preprotein translocase subunit SecY
VASASQQHVTSLNFVAFAKAKELHQWILFTLGVLVVLQLLGLGDVAIECFFPEGLISAHNLRFRLGDASLLIGVVVASDILGQMQVHRLVQQHEPLRLQSGDAP